MNYNYDFDIAALLLYLLVVFYYLKTKHIKNAKTRIFNMLMFCAILTPILDILGCEVIVRKAPAGVTYAVNMLYYLIEQATNFCFFAYVIAQLEMRSKMSKTRQLIMSLPIVLVSLVILSNPLHGTLFTYENYVYESGPFRVVIVWGPLLYFAWAIFYAISKKTVIHKNVRAIIYSIAVINSMARAIQFYFTGFLVHSYAVAVSILILYLYSAKTDRSIDSRTGLASRSILEEEVKKLMFNHVNFHAVFVRIADYDLITTSYGIQNTEQYMNNIASFMGTFSNKSPAYQVSNNCYVVHLFDEEKPERVKKLICEKLDHSYNINGLDIFCSYFVTSISFPENCPDYETYIAFLTYFKKMHGLRYGIVPFEELRIKDKARESVVERAIEKAIKNNSFDVFYQPICTTSDQKFITAEALVRLFDDELGMISPAEFIPLAESNGTISAIGNIVLDKVCQFIEEHDLQSLGIQYIETNLSTTQCLQRNFIDTVDSITSFHKVDSKLISFEITETASNCAPVIFTENLRLLRERGYRLALDDFGTGYANLQRLVTTDFDIIKFDKEMTQKTCDDVKLHDLFEKMQNMFHSMDAKVVAEGVETKEQYEFLKSIGCDFIQGYYFSKPLPQKEFLEFMEQHI